uniref:Uncharacterized protein n=1 Tax=Acrobeloides nanus TaxID=290746 RepID=A0A914DH57_9BILA
MSSMDSYLAKKNADKRSQEICKNHEKDAILQKLSKEYFIHLPQNSNNNALQANGFSSSVKFKRPASTIANEDNDTSLFAKKVYFQPQTSSEKSCSKFIEKPAIDPIKDQSLPNLSGSLKEKSSQH